MFQIQSSCIWKRLLLTRSSTSNRFQTNLRSFADNKISISEKYERKTPIEHVLLRPGMYIGQMEISQIETWIYDETSKKMKKEKLSYSPALLKIFDEIIVNAADNKHRDRKMDQIDVIIDRSTRNKITVSVKNNGKGIPIQIHPTEKIYIPELIFGHLLTGSNFNDNQNLMTGGRHGYGAKLTNIFSKEFTVETYDHRKNLLYSQKWADNMTIMSPPIIKDGKSLRSDYTMITFRPDLQKFGYELSSKVEQSNRVLDDFIKIITRRVYDIAASVAPIKVTMNSKPIEIESFLDYVKLFTSTSQPVDTDDRTNHDVINTENTNTEKEISNENNENETEDPIFFSSVNDRWNVAVKRSQTGEFETMSFVNSVWTPRGGTHVTYITNQIIQAFGEEIKKKKLPSVTPGSIRNRLMVFIRCDIENPTFDSQSKDTLTKRSNEFGSTCILSQTFLSKIVKKSGIIDDIQRILHVKDLIELNEITSNVKKGRTGQLVDVPKLEDAHDAGSSHSLDCTLILTEGDSAKALAVAGIEVVGRKRYGVLPLRGKILNVRDIKVDKVGKNEELVHLVKALGLSFSKDYRNGLKGEGLRYGHVMMMCDQDNDGSHIKGLIINFFHYFWPNLLKIEGFLQQFVTPLVKVKLGSGSTSSTVSEMRSISKLLTTESNVVLKKETNNVIGNSDVNIKSFYSLPEFDEWIESNKSETSKYSIKYYKGLGTNTSIEGQNYFKALDKHKKVFKSYREQEDNNMIDLAFSKTRARDRREWLNTKYDPQVFINPKDANITYEDFVNKELIQFSYADNYRSLPHIVDGLKPSQRKVLYACFKRKLDQEIKVVQLAGYVAEHTAYHHGEASLHTTIVNMAQDFVGSNNIPLLEPAGQFGTRAQGGQDYASPRYIFTRLSPIARYLFPELDDMLLEYLKEDGQQVEPRHYIPIIPTILLNGSDGIGTGWSTHIPQYYIGDVIDHITALVKKKKPKYLLEPRFQGFKGDIIPQSENAMEFTSVGIVNGISNNTIEISELPIGVWTNDYKEYLCKLMDSGVVKSIMENHTTTTIDFKIKLPSDTEINTKNKEELIKLFKLSKGISIGNMHGFNPHGRIQTYSNPEEIIHDYYPIRLEAYQRRKEVVSRKLQVDELISRNKARFVKDILSGELEIFSRSSTNSNVRLTKPMKEEELVRTLKTKGYITAQDMSKILKDVNIESDDSRNTNRETNVDATGTGMSKPYGYLLEMSIQSLTEERSVSLQKSAEEAKKKYDELKSKSVEDLWITDLEALKTKAKEMGYISL